MFHNMCVIQFISPEEFFPTGMSPLSVARSTVCVLRRIWCCLHFLNRDFEMNLIGFVPRATTLGWKLALKKRRQNVSPENLVSVLQYSSTAVPRNPRVPQNI